MKEKEFDKLAKQETDRMLDVMCSKSADYADDKDKLFNFKQAGRMDSITPIEALRGMWLKHRASIQQGLDELMAGKKPRPRKWWIEKLTDDRNYNLLLLALLEEEYFIKDGTSPGYGNKENYLNIPPHTPFGVPWVHMGSFYDFPLNVVPLVKAGTLMQYCGCGGVKPIEDNEPEKFGGFEIKKSCNDKEWFIRLKGVAVGKPRRLYKDLKLHLWGSSGKHDQSYYKTKAEARATIMAYKNKLVLHVRHASLGWYVGVDGNDNLYLRDDLQIHDETGYAKRKAGLQSPYGYYPTKEIAEAYAKAYEEKHNVAR